MKLIFILAFSMLSFSSFATERKFLVKYYDCAGSTNFVSDMLPIFSKVDGVKRSTSNRANVYTGGLNVSVNTLENGDIESFNFGKNIDFTIEDLNKGIEFGVAKLTAHTIQLVNFDPKVGGVLEFGFLKKFSARKINPEIRDQNLVKYFSNRYGDQWRNYKVYLVRNQDTNDWKIQDAQSNDVGAVFGILEMRKNVLVFGISEMFSVSPVDVESLDLTRRYITVESEKKSYLCEIN
jgi:hypothetical protein